MPQESCKLFHRGTGFVRKLLESGADFKRDDIMNVVFENSLETDGRRKLTMSIPCCTEKKFYKETYR